MIQTSPRAARIRLLIALAVVLAVGAGLWALGVLGTGGGAMGAQERALIEAFERKTGLTLSLQKGELDASASSWRGFDVEVRPRGVEGPLGRPLLSASVVELKLDGAALLRGELHIERALVHDATLNLDRRSEAKSTISAQALLAQLPASIEAPRAQLVVYTDEGYVTLGGLSATLQRTGDTVRGTLEGAAAGLAFQHVKEPAPKPFELAIKTNLTWQPSGLSLNALELRRGQTTFKGDAQLGASTELLRVRSEAADLADLGVWLEPLVGAGARGQGVVEVELAPRGVKGRFDLRDVQARGLAFDRVQADVERRGDSAVLTALVAERGEARVRSDELFLDVWGVRSGTLQIERVPVRPVLSALLGEVPADGVARGTLRASSDDGGTITVDSELTLEAPSISGYRFDKGELRARLALAGGRAQEVTIESLALSGRTAELTAKGSASPSGQIALDASGRLTLGGQVLEGQGKVSGSWARPETTATLGSAGSGPLALTVRLSGKDIREGTLELRGADFSASMPVIQHAGAPYGTATARIALSSGRIDDVRSLAGQGELKDIALGYGELRVKSAAPVSLALDRGRVALRGLTLVEQGASSATRWQVDGAIDLDRGLDLEVRAQLPLAELLATTPFIGAVEGSAQAKLKLEGKLDAPRVGGEIETREAQLEVGPSKLPWRDVRATLLLKDNALALQHASGLLGSGKLAVGGTIALEGIKARRVELALALDKFALEPEPRFEVELDADAKLDWKHGDALPVLGGVVTLKRLHYGRHVQLPEAVIAIGRSKKSARAPTVALKLDVVQSAPITIRNDFLDAELEITAEGEGEKAIRLVGTDVQIGALGALSVTRGRALFRGATLTIRKGRIALVSDDRIVPALELEADAPAKRRPGGLIAFRAKGDPQKFGLTLHCAAKDSGEVPPPFACDYAGDAMRCGAFEELTALWACQPPL